LNLSHRSRSRVAIAAFDRVMADRLVYLLALATHVTPKTAHAQPNDEDTESQRCYRYTDA